jgi:ABC-2 type transport system permease protein
MASAETTFERVESLADSTPLSVWLTLLRHQLRQLAASSAAWIIGLVAMATLVAAAYATTMPTIADRQALARSVEGNPAFEAMFGRAIALDTIEGFTMWRGGGPLVPAIVIWGMIAGTRLARSGEDKGYDELLLAGAFSRRALLLSALAALALVILVYALLSAALLVASSEISVAGAWRFALAMSGAFALFASLGALLVQLTPNRSLAVRIGLGLVGVAFATRVLSVIEATPGWVPWITPFGWFSETGTPQIGSNVPFLLFGFGTVLFSSAAVILSQRRELHGSLLIQEDNSATHSHAYESLWVHEVVQQRPALIGFGIVGLLLATIFGLVASEFVTFIEDFPAFAALLEDFGLTRADDPAAFIGLILSVLVVVVTLFAANHVAAMRDSEASGRLAVLLILPLHRYRWLAITTLAGAAGVALVSLLIGLGAMLGTAVTGTPLAPVDALRAGLNLMPIAIMFLGLGILVFGIHPPLTGPLIYVVMLASYLIVLMDAFLDIPTFVVSIAPFDHLAMVPGEPANVTANAVFLLVGVAGAVTGAIAFRRRDLMMD